MFPSCKFPQLFFSTCTKPQKKVKKIGEFMYSLDHVIGKGTSSSVYTGVQIRTKKPVAIKVIELNQVRNRGMTSLLQQQASLMTELQHENVVKCLVQMKTEERFYFVTELCKKDNLQTIVKENGPLHMPQIQKVIFGIFSGLKYLWTKNIIHRDIKSSNILFSQSGTPKIADFGFATRSLYDFKDHVIVGTPLYMSPEALLQQRFSNKTDVWSFGIVIFQMLFGYLPLEHCTNSTQLQQQIVKPTNIPKNRTDIPNSLAELLEGCLQVNSRDRWGMQKLAKSQYILKLERKFGKSEDLQLKRSKFSQSTNVSCSKRGSKCGQILQNNLKRQFQQASHQNYQNIRNLQSINRNKNQNSKLRMQSQKKHQFSTNFRPIDKGIKISIKNLI